MSVKTNMKVVGFAGFSGSGKTTLVEQVVRLLRERGHSVSVIKHAHSSFDVDRPGKDSYRHREAGAYEVLLASTNRMALLREWQLNDVPKAEDLIAELREVDWVLIEGFKHAKLPKIEVWRKDTEQPHFYLEDERIIAVATDSAEELPQRDNLVMLDMNRPQAVAEFLLANAARFEWIVDGK